MKTILSVRIPEKLAEELENLAKETNRNKSDIIRECISYYIWKTKFENLKSELKSFAEKIGLTSEDDIFRFVS